jgi:mono/diheme cytochrome c family protein
LWKAAGEPMLFVPIPTKKSWPRLRFLIQRKARPATAAIMRLKSRVMEAVMTRAFCSAALVALVLTASPAGAQMAMVSQPGHASAQRLCAECHAVQPWQHRSPRVGAPSFTAIARVPGMTSAALRVALATSHRTMPNVMVPQDELGGIVDYILSLKRSR